MIGIEIDGEKFDVGIVNITRKASLITRNLGETLDGISHVQAVGTRYDYEVTFLTKRMNVAEYDRLYELLTSPVDSHIVTMPYGQSTITFNATVSTGSDSIVFDYTNLRRWNQLKVNFEALEMARLPE